MTFVQCWANVEDVGPTLYKCYTNVLFLLGIINANTTGNIEPMAVYCWDSCVVCTGKLVKVTIAAAAGVAEVTNLGQLF